MGSPSGPVLRISSTCAEASFVAGALPVTYRLLLGILCGGFSEGSANRPSAPGAEVKESDSAPADVKEREEHAEKPARQRPPDGKAAEGGKTPPQEPVNGPGTNPRLPEATPGRIEKQEKKVAPPPRDPE